MAEEKEGNAAITTATPDVHAPEPPVPTVTEAPNPAPAGTTTQPARPEPAGEPPLTDDERAMLQAMMSPPADAAKARNAAGDGQTASAAGQTGAPPSIPGRQDSSARLGFLARVPTYALLGVLSALVGIVLAALYFSQQQQTSMAVIRQSMDRLANRLGEIQATQKKAATPVLTIFTPEQYHNVIEKAGAETEKGNLDQAVLLYRAAIDQDTDAKMCDEAYYRLGGCLARMGRQIESIQAFRTVVTGYPGSEFWARSAYELSELLMKQNSYAPARAILYTIIGRSGKLTGDEKACVEKAYFALARTYQGEGKMIEESRPASLKVMEAPPASDESRTQK